MDGRYLLADATAEEEDLCECAVTAVIEQTIETPTAALPASLCHVQSDGSLPEGTLDTCLSAARSRALEVAQLVCAVAFQRT